MAILVRDDGGAAPEIVPVQPPVAAVPVQAPVAAPVQAVAPAFVSPSGSGDEGARGMPQQGVGPIGPIVSPTFVPPPTVAAPPTANPLPPTTGGGAGGTEPHRGLPQPGDLPGDVGPIVKPHGEPSPSAPGGTTKTTETGGTTTEAGAGDGGDRTLASASAPDHRDQASYNWLRFQQFFSTRVPHDVKGLNAARAGLPKVVR